ncbi:MAG: hypothetical protein KOO62_03315 [candidate division Zixibacteria bacterium]|nr:hypothetical protein [candidate division Zixibacteria bacterium]
MKYLLLPLLFVMMPLLVVADDENQVDTSDVGDTSLVTPTDVPDTTLPTYGPFLDDDTLGTDSYLFDSLTAAERTQISLDEKYEKHQEELRRRRLPSLSVHDTLITWFTSQRLNRRDDLDRSFYHDAGDYFRFDPSFFVLEHQVTPMRKTVQPYGVGGNRLNVLADGHRFEPFEHNPEPDGLVDMNDIPTALDQDVFVLNGPIGQVLGGTSALASLITRPKPPDTYKSESSLLADKGGLGYAFVRGRYSKKHTDGRLVDMSVGYRKAEGPTIDLLRASNSYHYYADLFFPLRGGTGLRAWGQLYDRDGPLTVRPDSYGATIKRYKFDRSANVSLTLDNSTRTSRYEMGYKHLRQGSYLTGISDGRFDKTGHGAFAQRQWLWCKTIMSVRVDGDYLEYDDHLNKHDHLSGEALLQMGLLRDGWRCAASIGSAWVEEYDFLPRAAGVVFREGDKSLVVLSFGYSERAPTMHELYLRFQKSLLYGSGATVYADGGDSLLVPESQLVGSFQYEYGSLDNRISLSVTGGQITDGINWTNELVLDADGDYKFFTPANGDISFASVTLQPRLQLRDFLTFVGGASYHHVDYKDSDSLAYTPEYQGFSGLELHWFWRDKLMDLFAYGEVVYIGPYDGYDEKGLGETAVINVKLSFALKDYRMHFVFQNLFDNQYRARERLTFPGRFFYYGFTWNFLD